MEDGQFLEFLMKLLLGALGLVITAAVPIITKFVTEWLNANTNEKTMIVLSELVQVAIESVEDRYGSGDGINKKAFVMDTVQTTAKLLGLKVSDEVLETLIDMLLEASVMRTFNTPMPQLPDGFE